MSPRGSGTSADIKISILVPCYNGSAYLGTCLDSVVAAVQQVDVVVEVVLQDGGSTDDSLDIVSRYRDSLNLSVDSRADTGQAEALSRALARATGDVIGWLNADDIYEEMALRRVLDAVAYTEAVEPADIIFGDYAIIDQHGELLRRHEVSTWDWGQFFKIGCYAFSGAIFWRGEFLKNLDFTLRYRYCMDFDLYLRAGNSVNACKANGALGSFRLHAASKTGSERWQFPVEARRVRQEHVATSSFSGWDVNVAFARHLVLVAFRPLRFSPIWVGARRLFPRRF